MHTLDVLEAVAGMRGAFGLKPFRVETGDGETHEVTGIEHRADGVHLRVAGLPDAGAVAAHIQEAANQYPAEDFLAGVIEDFAELRENVRGANRDLADRIAAKLEDVAQCTFNAADYGRDELRKADTALGG